VTDERERRRLAFLRDTIVLIETQARLGREAVLDNATERDALLWRLYTVADAATELSGELKARHPELPWDRIRGFCNIAAHGYLRLAMDAAWEIAEHHVSDLRAAVEQELRDGGETTDAG
jgi:uncharacterized protein with HEPN domain